MDRQDRACTVALNYPGVDLRTVQQWLDILHGIDHEVFEAVTQPAGAGEGERDCRIDLITVPEIVTKTDFPKSKSQPRLDLKRHIKEFRCAVAIQ